MGLENACARYNRVEHLNYHFKGPHHDTTKVLFLGILGLESHTLRIVKGNKLLVGALVCIRSLVDRAPVRLPAVLVLKNASSLDGTPLEFSRISCNSSGTWVSTLGVILITLNGGRVQRNVLTGARCNGLLGIDGEAIERNT